MHIPQWAQEAHNIYNTWQGGSSVELGLVHQVHDTISIISKLVRLIIALYILNLPNHFTHARNKRSIPHKFRPLGHCFTLTHFFNTIRNIEVFMRNYKN